MTKEVRLYNGEETISNKWYWENWTATCKRMKLDHYPILNTKIDSKWTEALNIRPEIIEGVNLQNI